MKPNLSSYYGLILVYTENDMVDSALEVKQQLENAGISPNKLIYDAIINGLTKCKREGEAIFLKAEYFKSKDKFEQNSDSQ